MPALSRARISLTMFFAVLATTSSIASAGQRDCASGALRSLLERRANAAPTTAAELGERLGRSNRFAFYRGNGWASLDRAALEPGKSYTTIERGNTVIIGEIAGENGGTAGTHVALGGQVRDRFPLDLREMTRAGDFNFTRGGSIRVNADGSVDVSGFHNQGISAVECERAMRTLVEAFESQGVRVRISTTDRLPPPVAP